jgi:hypothetical protein
MRVDAERLEDRLAPDEPPYKSRGEAQVGRLLDRYGIPFFYEQPRLVMDRGRHRIWRPDFTLPSYDSLIVEYAGMPDLPDYMAGIRHKQQVYRTNEIPALFLYPADLRGPSWPAEVIAKINRDRGVDYGENPRGWMPAADSPFRGASAGRLRNIE